MQIFKTLRFATWRAFGFWHLASFITDALLLTAFILRVYGLASPEGNRDQLLLRSFQVLSFVSPFIWCVLVYSEAHRNQEPPSRTSASVFFPPHVFPYGVDIEQNLLLCSMATSMLGPCKYAFLGCFASPGYFSL